MTVLHGEHFTKTRHRASYPAIDPRRPDLSQAGRTVLITGGSAGIGLAMAKGFAMAGATSVIILGRRQNLLTEALETLMKEFPATLFIGRQVDITNISEVEGLWSSLETSGTVVDVLVLNAAKIPTPKPVIELGREPIWSDFTANVRANIDMTDLFYNQKRHDPAKKLFLLHVSTSAIHDFDIAGSNPNYTVVKTATTSLMQQIARGVSVDKMQVVSFHPGAIYTMAAKEAGYPEVGFEWDNENLPGHFAVWLASDEAAFLHGRFVWSSWDVDELRNGEIHDRIVNDGEYLKVGVVGL